MSAAVLPVNQANLEKIENYINDQSYREILENAVNYNTRLCIERRLRLPFLDSQTGVAQNHSNLYMKQRHRMPGTTPGQIYTYPRPRWRKRRRQYLTMNSRAFARAADSMLDGDLDIHNISQVENPALQDTDSKDSQLLKDDMSKEWYYDDQDMLDIDGYDEPDQDSDLDYEETYSKRNKRRKGTGRGSRGTDSPSTPGRRKGGGRGRKKAIHNFDPTPGDPDKPFACERTPGRRGRQPGNMQSLPSPQSQAPPNLPPNLPNHILPSSLDDPPMPVLVPEKNFDIPSSSNLPPMMEPIKDNKAMPSPYCDFCLGDTRENKKTGGSEELVSCSDCGRSGKGDRNEVLVKPPGKKGRKKRVL